jgi:heat shock protein HtpX
MYKAIAANKRNTILIMAVFLGLITAVGYAVSLLYGNTSITFWVLGGVTIYALLQYFFAAKLATSITGAKQIEKRDNPRLYRIVENLSITLGLPMPKVYVIEDAAPNAFATGRDPQHAIVAATTGLMDIMDDNELEAVMAHEMGHVQNYDIRVSMIAFGLVSAIAVLSDLIMHMFILGDRRDSNVNPVVMIIGVVVIILAPIIATMIQLAISRQREFLADASGAMTTRDPESLADALEKLQKYGQPMKHQNSATAHLFFSNPLKGGGVSKLFRTHPPLEERVKRLRKNAGTF